MEAVEVDESTKATTLLSTAEAFVEGGIQDSCDAACSICLEEFCDNDPATVTNCKHQFHLQCVLEWCQRNSNCPMCWQSPLSLQDSTSQGLLEGVERERDLRTISSRNATIFRHSPLRDFELLHVTRGTSNTEVEERKMRRLAAAAAKGRSQHLGRRDGQRQRSSGHGRSHFVVLSSNPHPLLVHTSDERQRSAANQSLPSATLESTAQQSSHFPSALAAQVSVPTASDIDSIICPGSSLNFSTTAQSPRHGRGGPSDLQAQSESMKSRFNAVSIRCKESISKSTRGWKEKWFPRNSSIADADSSQNNVWQGHE